jgi:hypothetical protein
VLEGAIRSQVNDGPVTTYEAGQSFSELPGDRHGVSANASETKPAKLLAVFVVDTNETELTIPLGILPPETWPVWLGEETAEPVQLKALLAPYNRPHCCMHHRSGGPFNGADVTVKDSKRFADIGGWGYFNFNHHEPKAASSKVKAKDECAYCHIVDAKKDEVWAQFYRIIDEQWRSSVVRGGDF